MADDLLPTLYVFRSNVFVQSKSDGGETAIAERGFLVAGEAVYYTIERRGGYVSVPLGEFEIQMEFSPTKKVDGQPRKQFRIYGHNVTNDRGKLAALLIHLGNYPHHITGCIAPGISELRNGVGQSKKAMEEIFKFCGCFGAGKKARLVVGNL